MAGLTKIVHSSGLPKYFSASGCILDWDPGTNGSPKASWQVDDVIHQLEIPGLNSTEPGAHLKCSHVLKYHSV